MPIKLRGSAAGGPRAAAPVGARRRTIKALVGTVGLASLAQAMAPRAAEAAYTANSGSTPDRVDRDLQVDGRLGVGTAPGQVLDVRRDQDGSTYVQVFNGSAGPSAAAGHVFGYDGSGQYGALVYFGPGYTPGSTVFQPKRTVLQGADTAGLLLLASNAAGVVSFGTGGYTVAKEWARFSAGGNLGVGTALPVNPVDVQRDQDGATLVSVLNANLTGAARAGFLFGYVAAGGAYGSLIYFGPSYTNAGMFVRRRVLLEGADVGGVGLLATNPVGAIVFATGGAAAGNERARIDSAGNVGVGTTTPQAKLDVAGDVRYSGVLKSTAGATVADQSGCYYTP